MSPDEAHTDSFESWKVAIGELRLQGLRAGTFQPVSDHERHYLVSLNAERACRTCRHSADVFMGEFKPPRHDLRCFRTRSFRGAPPEPHAGVGASCKFETDGFNETHRLPGDKCGPQRLHWERA